MPAAVIFDLDGVLLDSEGLWSQAKQEVVRARGGHWRAGAARSMLGMSAPEWSAYMRDELAVPLTADQINREVVARLAARYRSKLPLLPGAIDAVRDLGAHWPLGLASSANRELIDLFIDLSGLSDAFQATVSSEEVGRGKPSPDVYLEAARRLGVAPALCVAIEDSGNGLRSAVAAGMTPIAVPNRDYPPEPDALALAAASVATPGEVTVVLVRSLGVRVPVE